MRKERFNSSLHGRVIKDFLEDPNRHNFLKLFEISLTHSRAYLRFLASRGFSLPDSAAHTESPIDTVTFDILGFFFAKESGKPFGKIFDFFQRHGYKDFESTESDDIYDQYLTLLHGFIKRQLTRLRNDENPQIHNLKRAIREALTGKDYRVAKDYSDKQEYVHSVKYANNQRLEKDLLSYDDLIQLVLTAFLHDGCTNRPRWIELIFQSLNEKTDVQNRLKQHELTSAMIAINSEYSMMTSPNTHLLETPKITLLRTEIEKERQNSMSWIRSEIIPEYVAKGKIADKITGPVYATIEALLTDFSALGEHDSIPEYFRECMPEELHDRFYTDFKNIFDYLVHKAKEDFAMRLKNNPIIRKGRDYFINRKGI